MASEGLDVFTQRLSALAGVEGNLRIGLGSVVARQPGVEVCRCARHPLTADGHTSSMQEQ